MSVVAHVTPLSWGTSATDYNWIASVANQNEDDPDDTNHVLWGIYIDEKGFVNVVQNYDEPLAFSALQTRKLTSKRQVPTDGTPINIIYTIDTELQSGNMKLFIDGHLEDISGKLNTSGTVDYGWKTRSFDDIERVNAFQVGHKLPSLLQASTGLMYALHIGCQAANVYLAHYPYWDSLTTNKSLAEPLTWNAKLFVKDYHNIRGKGVDEVAQSGNVSWARTSFSISTQENYEAL